LKRFIVERNFAAGLKEVLNEVWREFDGLDDARRPAAQCFILPNQGLWI